jgi:hypothetical protein
MILAKEIQLWKSYVNHIKRFSVDALKGKKIGAEIWHTLPRTIIWIAVGGAFIFLKVPSVQMVFMIAEV